MSYNLTQLFYMAVMVVPPVKVEIFTVMGSKNTMGDSGLLMHHFKRIKTNALSATPITASQGLLLSSATEPIPRPALIVSNRKRLIALTLWGVRVSPILKSPTCTRPPLGRSKPANYFWHQGDTSCDFCAKYNGRRRIRSSKNVLVSGQGPNAHY